MKENNKTEQKVEALDIPRNLEYESFENRVVRACNAVVKRMGSEHFKKFGFAQCLFLNHGRASMSKADGDMGITEEVAYEVARRFKEKGYYAHFNRSIMGTPYALTIKTYPTEGDI
jgi:hypothetical protein